jgi:hypothetical protein
MRRAIYSSPHIFSNMLRSSILLLVLLNFLIVSCDNGLQGSLNENQPPNTSLTLNEINLPEGERLVSQVNISWWGDDPDGYIVGYEFFIGDVSSAADEDWIFTESTDSTFILPIEEGNLDADVEFTVRAIDNDDARDDSPASLTFPIRNTEPNIEFNLNETPPDTTFRVMSFGYNASDPDGNANLNRVEIALNDTASENAWKQIPLNVTFVTLKIDDTVAEPTAEVLVGRAVNEAGLIFDSVYVDADNTFYIRSFDNAEAVSEVEEFTWYVKKQTSRILFLNDFYSTATATEDRAALHLGLLAQAGITEVDYLDISDGFATGGQRVPLTQALPDRSLADPTTNMMLAEWDHIYWISNDLSRNIGYALELTQDFFDNGGTMFVNIPSKFIASDNPLLQFLPFEGVEQASTGENFYIARCAEISESDEITDAPFLQLNRIGTGYFPIIPFNESTPLFEAPFETRNFLGVRADFEGSHLISAMNPDETILYFGIDLDDFTTDGSTCESDGNTPPPSELGRLIEFITDETLGFEQ